MLLWVWSVVVRATERAGRAEPRICAPARSSSPRPVQVKGIQGRVAKSRWVASGCALRRSSQGVGAWSDSGPWSPQVSFLTQRDGRGGQNNQGFVRLSQFTKAWPSAWRARADGYLLHTLRGRVSKGSGQLSSEVAALQPMRHLFI